MKDLVTILKKLAHPPQTERMEQQAQRDSGLLSGEGAERLPLSDVPGCSIQTGVGVSFRHRDHINARRGTRRNENIPRKQERWPG